MKFPSELKSLFLLLISASIGGFIGAYLAPIPTAFQPPIVDTRALDAVSTKLETTAAQFAEFKQSHQDLINQKHDSEQLQQTWLTRLQNIEEKLNELESTLLANSSLATQTNALTAASEISSEQAEFTKNLQQQLDYQSLQDIMRDMHSEDMNARQRALRTLALIGSAEIKQAIGHIILDETEDITLRRDLIQSLDWQGLGDQLINLFENSQDSTIRAATVSVVDTSRLGETEKQAFETHLISNFADESDDFIRIVTLDYFSNHNRQYLHTLADSLSQQELSPQLRDHIQFLITPETQYSLDNIPIE